MADTDTSSSATDGSANVSKTLSDPILGKGSSDPAPATAPDDNDPSYGVPDDYSQHASITPGGWTDEFAGQGGQYIIDPKTGNRVRVGG